MKNSIIFLALMFGACSNEAQPVEIEIYEEVADSILFIDEDGDTIVWINQYGDTVVAQP